MSDTLTASTIPCCWRRDLPTRRSMVASAFASGGEFPPAGNGEGFPARRRERRAHADPKRRARVETQQRWRGWWKAGEVERCARCRRDSIFHAGRWIARRWAPAFLLRDREALALQLASDWKGWP